MAPHSSTLAWEIPWVEEKVAQAAGPGLGRACGFHSAALGATALDYGEGSGTPLQYSCLENPMDGGAW